MLSDLTDSNAVYLVIVSPSPGKRKEAFLPSPEVFCAALLAAAELHSARGCQARTALSRGLGGVEEPSSQVRGRWGGSRGRCSGARLMHRMEPVQSEGFIGGCGEILERQQDTADGPVLPKLKMNNYCGTFAWQKTGVWGGLEYISMHIHMHI